MINESELKKVNKPAQYLGGEINSVVKDPREVDFRFCLTFPDTYEVGMSHVGMQILYDVINRDPKAWAERAFVPLKDMEELLRTKGLPLYSLESKTPLNQFDALGFSLQYELCATGVLGILDLAGLEFYAKDRKESDPLIIGGGPYAYHPEPIADFFDLFLVGDGEYAVIEMINCIRTCKDKGLSKKETLQALAKVKGIYIPALFEPEYRDGDFIGVKSKLEDYQGVQRALVPSLEDAPYPTKPIVPNIQAVHDRLSVEVMRGCVRGCRFCQAGYLYRPQRERKPEDLLKIIDDSLGSTGYEELSLLSLSTADYCSILPLLGSLKEKYCQEDELAISFPSTRVDSLKPELLQEVQTIRRLGFTVAPEAGTQRLRDVINKGVTDEEILEMSRNVYRLGWGHIKMYFMIGLPTETDQDILGIVDIARRVNKLCGPKQYVTVSVSTLVPKPFTPFQWAEQITEAETRRRQSILYSAFKKSPIQFRYHKSYSTFLEGIFARGDRRLAPVVKRAYELGCRLDGWVEKINKEAWEQAFEEFGIDPHYYLRERNTEETLPWDHVSCDIPKRYFLKEWQRAIASRTTPDCLTQTCSTCGACDYDSQRNVLFDRKRTETRLNIVNPAWEAIIEARERSEKEQDAVATQKGDAAILFAAKNGSVPLLEELPEEDLAQPEFGSGSLDYSEERSRIDYPFQSPDKPVHIHENVELKEVKPIGKESNPLNRPEIPTVQRIRLQYSKREVIKFTGHLELSSIFFRACRKAKVPIAFSRGFSPKPKIIFGPPLQLGVESECEFVDIFLTKKLDPSELGERLNAALPSGIRVLATEEVPLKDKALQHRLCRQSYLATLSSDSSLNSEDLYKEIYNWKSRKIERVKKGKTKSISLADSIDSFSIYDNQIEFDVLHDGNNATVKPLEAIGAITNLDPNQFVIKKINSIFH